MNFRIDRSRRSEAIATPFVASWLSHAAAGNLHDPKLSKRASAWAAWAVESFVGIESQRSYLAILLPSRFYNPKGDAGPSMPHLEIPTSVLNSPSPEFPWRLALMGNGLEFPWFIYSEVTAIRRVLFKTSPASIMPLVGFLESRDQSLRDGLAMLRRAAAPRWDVVEADVVSSPDGLSKLLTEPFTVAEVDSYVQGAARLGLEVRFEPRLAEQNGVWASRRMGVWQVSGTTDEGRFHLGTLTPRLTRRSTLSDPLFSHTEESPLAVLVHGLVLRRLASEVLDVPASVLGFRAGATPVPEPEQKVTGTVRPHLRAIRINGEGKTPEASPQAAIAFIQTYKSPKEAWEMLSGWAGSTHLLTVSEDTFSTAFRRAALRVRRAEEPDREDIDLILPLAWDHKGGVVRVTFSRGSRNAA